MSVKDSIVSALDVVSVTIGAGSSLSQAIQLGGLRLFAIAIPATWTAANLTFQMSCDNGASWVDVYDQNGSEVTASAAASRCVTLPPAVFSSLHHLRVRSGTASAPISQSASVDLQLILRVV